jgi:hypothetical protein
MKDIFLCLSLGAVFFVGRYVHGDLVHATASFLFMFGMILGITGVVRVKLCYAKDCTPREVDIVKAQCMRRVCFGLPLSMLAFIII